MVTKNKKLNQIAFDAGVKQQHKEDIRLSKKFYELHDKKQPIKFDKLPTNKQKHKIVGFADAEIPRGLKLGTVMTSDNIIGNSSWMLEQHKHQPHYTQFKIQPMVYCQLNGLNWCASNVVKYVSRYKLKNGVEDLKKAQHYLEKLIEYEQTGDIKL